jgi:hypothetical protein
MGGIKTAFGFGIDSGKIASKVRKIMENPGKLCVRLGKYIYAWEIQHEDRA